MKKPLHVIELTDGNKTFTLSNGMVIVHEVDWSSDDSSISACEGTLIEVIRDMDMNLAEDYAAIKEHFSKQQIREAIENLPDSTKLREVKMRELGFKFKVVQLDEEGDLGDE